MTGPAPDGLDPVRRRSLLTLVAGVGLGSTGYIAAVTVSTIVAQDLAGSAAWAGLPGATIVIGSAAGSALLSALMVRRGRRVGLTVGYLLGTLGALIAALALIAGSFAVFLVGTSLMGFANSANQLSRYTAADMYPVSRRASAIGIVVWGATIGAVLGPNLVRPAGSVAESAGLPELAGPYLALVMFVGVAAALTFARLRPDPYELADQRDIAEPHDGPAPTARSLLRRPTVVVSVAALIVGQVVMTLIMTMTPLHMTDHGHDIAAVGLVLSGHTFGMFALSPLSGRLTDRFGSPRTILAGMTVLAVSSALSVAAPPDGGGLLFVALFLLGFGWNLGFVAGSAMLASGVDVAERTRLEGITDALIWSSAAVASLGSGLLVTFAGFASLGLLGLAMVAIPVALLFARRTSLPAAAPR